MVAFILATVFQGWVWARVFARLPASGSLEAPLPVPVSVLICARNEALNLRLNLPAVLEQAYPVFEVLVIDDDSTDDTPALLEVFKKKYAHLRVLRVSPKTMPGKKKALSAGISAARFDYLVFTDADCRPAGNRWLEEMAAGFAEGVEVVLGYAPMRPGRGGFQRWVRFETIYTAMQYLSFAAAGMPYMGVGRNLAWKKILFERHDGFEAHADVPSGDDDLFVGTAAHAGNTAWRSSPQAFVFSEGENTLRGWLRQKARHLGAGKRYRRFPRRVVGLVALTHTLHYGLGVILLLTGISPLLVAALWAFRLALVWPVYARVFRLFREPGLLFWAPVFDGFLALYYGLFVPIILLRKQPVGW